MNLRQAIEALPISPGTSRRFTCVACRGTNTLGVTHTHSELKYKCFKASCGIYGVIPLTMDQAALRARLNRLPSASKAASEMPLDCSVFTHVNNSERALRYLSKYHCMHALEHRLADIRYDPRRERVAFLIKSPEDTSKVLDAAGRSLVGESPKWLRYAASEMPYICPSDGPYKSFKVIVEDATSATRIAPWASGVALLGTSLGAKHISALKHAEGLYVALDKDASRKAIGIAHKLSLITGIRAHVRLLEVDLKELSDEACERALALDNV